MFLSPIAALSIIGKWIYHAGMDLRKSEKVAQLI